ncbi:hypothetical protein [Burkholderia sp. BCC1999]|uniref:hypothetical protein n=1 Tax=Burkholderia sp. BCC1999 TaxID=2817448 RepID=UPI002AC34965|nr:hypothetical protein [Burkholderia sp. BCC1999]
MIRQTVAQASGATALRVTACFCAVISGVNRAYARADDAAQATFFDVARAVKAVA